MQKHPSFFRDQEAENLYLVPFEVQDSEISMQHICRNQEMVETEQKSQGMTEQPINICNCCLDKFTMRNVCRPMNHYMLFLWENSIAATQKHTKYYVGRCKFLNLKNLLWSPHCHNLSLPLFIECITLLSGKHVCWLSIRLK